IALAMSFARKAASPSETNALLAARLSPKALTAFATMAASAARRPGSAPRSSPPYIGRWSLGGALAQAASHSAAGGAAGRPGRTSAREGGELRRVEILVEPGDSPGRDRADDARRQLEALPARQVRAHHVLLDEAGRGRLAADLVVRDVL